MLVHQLVYQGERDRVVFRGNPDVTYGQLQTKVSQYRTYLYLAGVNPGENVGLFLRNSPAFIYAYMAIASLGAVVVPINNQLTVQEIAFIVKDAGIKNLVLAKRLELAAPLAAHGCTIQLIQHLVGDMDDFSPPAAAQEETADVSVDEDQPCSIIYTSGTTGNPKGAVLTHRNLISNVVGFTKVVPTCDTDNVLCILPLYHCLAWTCVVLGSLLHKASITILDTVVPKEVIEAIKRYGVTIVYGVPSVFMLLLKTAEPGDLARVHLMVSGGASLPQQVAENFLQKFGVAITEGYGLSEASPVVAVNPQGLAKILSIGKPIPGVEVKIVDTQDVAVAFGEVGELVVQGPTVMRGYFNLPAETEWALRGDWLHTGDLARQDEDGYLFIVDRLKDMIITTGENIYPREIEEILYRYPGVCEAAVIGVPDYLRGQVAHAYIVLEAGLTLDKKALKDYLRGKLAAYKIPREFWQRESLPKNQSGKILKRAIRE